MLIGASYYSECWPSTNYPVDAKLMAQAGFNVVRMGEFAWSRFQPEPDRYEFEWMDTCIGHMKANGLKVLLGIPTRVAPPWLVARDRSMLIVNQDGSRAAYGGRYEFCLNNPTFREAAAALVRAIATHYRDETGILGWHLDNEYGVGICYCEKCAAAFQAWLRDRYETLPELNRRWGSVYWSTEYTAWEQIDTPRATENRQNPAVVLDYRRFFSDVTIRFARMAADTVQSLGDSRPLMTNMHSSFAPHNLDYYTLNRGLDIAATNNNFPQTDSGQMNLDLAHGMKRKPFWSVEQCVSGGGVPVMTTISRPGDARRWTYLTVGHGADAVIYWAWRRYTLGQEQFWGGILAHDGEPGRFYDELRQTASELQRLWPVLEGTDVRPEVGIINSHDCRWALDVELNHPDLAYERLAHSFWRPLRDRGITCEFADPEADLSRYRLVIAPALLLINPGIVANLHRFVQEGGILVVTVRSGVKDWNNKIASGDLLQSWRALTGLRIAEFFPLDLHPGSRTAQFMGSYEQVNVASSRSHPAGQEIVTADGFLPHGAYPVETWIELLEPQAEVEVLATYGRDYCAGAAAVARRRIGAGQVVTLGTVLSKDAQDDLADWLLAEASVQQPIRATAGVEVLVRRAAARQVFILLNHTDEAQSIRTRMPMRDPLAGTVIDGQVDVPVRGVRVLVLDQAGAPEHVIEPA